MSENNNYWPKKTNIVDVIINASWTLMSWIIWSIFLIIFVFIITNLMDLPTNLSTQTQFGSNNPLLPFILSLITFLISFITSYINYYFLSLTESIKYKRSSIHFFNLLLFSIIIYIFFAPIYVIFWINSYENIIFIFIAHIIIINFWVVLLLEIINNYKYILLWFYWSFTWLIITSLISYFIFNFFSTWYARFLSLLLIMPLISWLIVFFKWLFELLYYKYFKLTWNDNLWDIFNQIINEENLEKKKNFINSQNNI